MSKSFLTPPDLFDRVRDESTSTKLVYGYTFNNRHRNSEGLYYLPPSYATEDLGISRTTYMKALAALNGRLLQYDPENKVVLLPADDALYLHAPGKVSAPTSDPNELPPRLRGAINALRAVPLSPLWRTFVGWARANPKTSALVEPLLNERPALAEYLHRLETVEPTITATVTQTMSTSSVTSGESRVEPCRVETNGSVALLESHAEVGAIKALLDEWREQRFHVLDGSDEASSLDEDIAKAENEIARLEGVSA